MFNFKHYTKIFGYSTTQLFAMLFPSHFSVRNYTKVPYILAHYLHFYLEYGLYFACVSYAQHTERDKVFYQQ